MNSDAKVIIAGAGIGGLTAALALLKRGFAVEIHEQAPELREVGAGLQLAPNSTRILADLGLRAELDSIAWQPSGKEIRLWNNGQAWPLFDLAGESVARYGAPYYMVHRSDLHNLLIDAVRRESPSAIRLGSRIIGLDQDAAGVTAITESGARAHGSIVVGADGVHSNMRDILFGAAKAEYTGLVAWRGVVPTRKLPEQFLRPVGVNWIGPHKHVIQYMLRGGELTNFVGVVERDDWHVESWMAEGTHAECHADFEGWHEDIHALISNIETLYKWALVARTPMESWSVGRATLLGDACHATLPFLAQGAGMAIEDGMILARCLCRFMPDYREALAQYEVLRLSRTRRVVTGSIEMGLRFHDSQLGDANSASQYVDREWQEDTVRARYDWLFTYDASSISIERDLVTEGECND